MWLWVLMFIIFVAAELAGPQLITIWLAIASLVGALLAYMGFSIYNQLWGFFGSAILLLVLTFPLTKKFRENSRHKAKTNVNLVIGEEGVIIKPASEFQTGLVKVRGQVWSCSPPEGVILSEGSVVKVEAVEGVRLIVIPHMQASAKVEKEGRYLSQS